MSQQILYFGPTIRTALGVVQAAAILRVVPSYFSSACSASSFGDVRYFITTVLSQNERNGAYQSSRTQHQGSVELRPIKSDADQKPVSRYLDYKLTVCIHIWFWVGDKDPAGCTSADVHVLASPAVRFLSTAYHRILGVLGQPLFLVCNLLSIALGRYDDPVFN